MPSNDCPRDLDLRVQAWGVVNETSRAENIVRTGIELGVEFHARRHVVDVIEGTCPEISGLNKQYFQARREDSKLLCETFHGSYMVNN